MTIEARIVRAKDIIVQYLAGNETQMSRDDARRELDALREAYPVTYARMQRKLGGL